MTDQVKAPPWKEFVYNITDQMCPHLEYQEHKGECSTCVREILVEVAARAAKEERDRLWKLFHDEARETDLGAMDVARGASVYNWAMWAARKIRDSKAD